jgi:hypothetical protein
VHMLGVLTPAQRERFRSLRPRRSTQASPPSDATGRAREVDVDDVEAIEQ